MKPKKGGVVILDFGSQYTKLIARRIREENVYSEILSPTTTLENILTKNPAAIILSGGPSSVNEEMTLGFDEAILDSALPVLGICYGLQLLVHHFGGVVTSKENGEYGFSKIKLNGSSDLFNGIKEESRVWMSHMDQVEKVPNDWQISAYSSNNIIAAVSSRDGLKVATQFHPEVSHTDEGKAILSNFLFKVSNCSANWNPGNFINEQIDRIRSIVGNKKVLVGVSGGVDSSVVAALMHKAIGDQSVSVLIDHGLLRKDEATNCVAELKAGLGVNINNYDESEIFIKKLLGVSDPEEKRKIIGNQFIKSFERISKDFGDIKFLAQGTLYPDIIESGLSQGKSAHVIKSHHNVGGLPENIDFDLIEPLKELFKDEVREVGKKLGITKNLIERHPFPGPGLAVRIIGEITKDRIFILQEADDIFINILHEDGIYNEIWQAFSVLIPVKTVGVMGDQRTYENLLALRAVTSVDGMTADWYKMPNKTLAKISNRIINSVSGVNRVVYDITSKPPGTIEWE